MKKLNNNGINKLKKYLFGDDHNSNEDHISLNLESIAKLAKVGIITESCGDGIYYCYDISNLLTEDLDDLGDEEDDERITQDRRRREEEQFQNLVTRLSEIFPTKNQIEEMLNEFKNSVVLKSELSDLIR